MRQEIVWRSKDIENGPWEVRKVFSGHMTDASGREYMPYTGVAQGGIVSLSDNTEGTTDGTWYCFLFEDYGAVGRVPVLLPMRWEDGWPVIGNDGKSTPAVMAKPVQGRQLAFPVTNDEFDNQPAHYQFSDREGKYSAEFAPNGSNLKLEWQWNHNPDMRMWSLTERKGWLRLSTNTTVENIRHARNTLTQRTFGPQCCCETKVDVSGLQDGDVAGLTSFQNQYGCIGVEMDGGQKRIVMHRAVRKDDADGTTIASLPLLQDSLYLRIDFNFKDKADKCWFYYSLDNKTWYQLGDTLQMAYYWPDFVGQRMGVFYFSTKTPGGHADFDYFRYGTTLLGNAQRHPAGNGNPLTGIEVSSKDIVTDAEGNQSLLMIPGNTTSLILYAKYADGYMANAANSAKPAIGDNAVVSVNGGTLTAISQGRTMLTASLSDGSNTAKTEMPIEVSFFPLPIINASYWGTGSYDAATKELTTDLYGFAGWNYEKGIDLSKYHYLIVKIREEAACGPQLRIYDENGYFAANYTLNLSGGTDFVVDLQSKLAKGNDGAALDLTHIYIVGFWSFGGSPIKFDSIYLSDSIMPTGISNVTGGRGTE